MRSRWLHGFACAVALVLGIVWLSSRSGNGMHAQVTPTRSTATGTVDVATLAKRVAALQQSFCQQRCEHGYFACEAYQMQRGINERLNSVPGIGPERGPSKFDPKCWPYDCTDGVPDPKQPVGSTQPNCASGRDTCLAQCRAR
jgi:hypothetical protein